MGSMRTTVTLDEEAAAIVETYAQARRVSYSKAISELVVRSMRRKPRIKYVNGRPVFDLPKPSEPVTTEHVRALEAEGW